MRLWVDQVQEPKDEGSILESQEGQGVLVPIPSDVMKTVLHPVTLGHIQKPTTIYTHIHTHV